ncbi:MAG: DNA-directed RNA polymerase subunit beta' [Armatimonadota bacterium]|nr:DNA-directed RNA polymerase subunit beta' [Armatimonadota bacterium]
MPVSTTDFEAVTIGLASPEEIRLWSHGEVKKPETINYRTYRPERDGLFCERIFGPVKDWECHCGKYKKVKFKGIICDRCGVEVTRSKVRRERMGHIELAAPVCHSWYLKGVPSPLSLLLDMSRRTLEEVVYFASYIVTDVDAARLHKRRGDIQEAVEREKEEIRATKEENIQALRQSYEEHLEGGEEEEEEEEQEPPEEELEEESLEALLEGDLLRTPEVSSEEELSRRIGEEEENAAKRIQDLDETVETLFELARKQLISEMEHRNLRDLVNVLERQLGEDFTNLFSAGLGAAAIKELLEIIDLDELARELRKEIDEHGGARRARAVKRLKVVEAFRSSKNRPEWMILTALPVLPAELRPMVQLDGGRFATSDLNDLYRRVINRNNRLRRIIEINAPESIVNHEKRLLQEAVDALIDNNRRSRPVTGSNRRQLKSLSDMLKGKEGRFRKNLLGKRVDYSGRSVIVVGPELRLHQCGLPREMALELFKPFVMHDLVEHGHTTNIKTAKRMVDRVDPVVWDSLERVIEGKAVLLNRAPTLHRLGIQAFEPVLIDGKAIQLHPLVCQAFNADFDGDQMAVHVPLSAHAQAEARLLMIASLNLFKPANGEPIEHPVYDIVLGCYYMTQQSGETPDREERKQFESGEAAISAYEHRKIDLHEPIDVRLPRVYVEACDADGGELEMHPRTKIALERTVAEHVTHEHPVQERSVTFTVTEELVEAVESGEVLAPEPVTEGSQAGETTQEVVETLNRALEVAAAEQCLDGKVAVDTELTVRVMREMTLTTVGRVIFNNHLPLDMPYYNCDVAKEQLSDIVAECYRRYGQHRTAQLVDEIKELGFKFVTRSGLSICLDDTNIETEKERIIARAEREVERINRAASEGVIAEDERERSVLSRWEQARQEISDNILDSIGTFNSLWMMVNSGARASMTHISQITGMRGLMSDPFGRLIEDLPVKNNLHDGLDLLEYFVSTHGARKGLADTALRTADAGYLTRRLVDVAQDVMIEAHDCGTTEGVTVTPMYVDDVYCPSCGMVDYHRDGVCHYCGEELDVPEEAEVYQDLRARIVGRWAAEDIMHPETDEVIVEHNNEIDELAAREIAASGIKQVQVRSPLTCELPRGVCALCYGRDLATQRRVEVGTAVGIIAAQSVGEPGTQLTMRTFHTGGVAGEYITGVADVKKRKQQALRSLQEDIDQGRVSLDVAGGGRTRRKAIKDMLKVLETSVRGLLRVEELFEARTPKGQAITADVDGVVAEVTQRGMRTVVIHSDHPITDTDAIRGERLAHDVFGPDKDDGPIAKQGEKLLKKVRERLKKHGIETVTIRTEHLVPYRGELLVSQDMEVRAGDPLTTGPVDPEKLLAMQGREGVQDYLLREIQRVYRQQHGININDKHIETIIRQMLLKVKVIDHGDTRFLPGELVDRFDFMEENERVQELGGERASAEPVLLGITQASLATESFLSAASFQRTTRVLTEAACENKRDPLHGLKENVIIGRLIPAGSGMPVHRDREVGFSGDVLEDLAVRGGRKKSREAESMEKLLGDVEAAAAKREAQGSEGSAE